MKRILIVCISLIIIIGLCACGGDKSNVQTQEVESDFYSKKDIESAIKTNEKEFKSGWSGSSSQFPLIQVDC